MIRNQQQMKNTVNVHILAPFHFASPVALIYCKLLTHGITWNTFYCTVGASVLGISICGFGGSLLPTSLHPHKLVLNKDVNFYEIFDDPN